MTTHSKCQKPQMGMAKNAPILKEFLSLDVAQKVGVARWPWLSLPRKKPQKAAAFCGILSKMTKPSIKPTTHINHNIDDDDDDDNDDDDDYDDDDWDFSNWNKQVFK